MTAASPGARALDPFLSVIIPAHNEEHRLPPTLKAVDAHLDKQPYLSEVVVVENGSCDLTAVVTEAYAADHPRVRLFRETGRGKGLAVRRGMLEAGGQYRFSCDADLSMPIDELAKFLPPALDSYDVAIGSREAPGARRFNEPAYRHFQGRVFSNLVKVFALPIEDPAVIARILAHFGLSGSRDGPGPAPSAAAPPAAPPAEQHALPDATI